MHAWKFFPQHYTNIIVETQVRYPNDNISLG